MLRVALLSKWHVHAADYLHDLSLLPEVEIAGVWDEQPARGKAWAEELHVPFSADLDTLLAREDVDAVVVTCPTSLHREVLLKAAAAKKHIYTEKVLAPTLAECREIEKAINDAGVKFCISTPYKTMPEYRLAKQLAEDGTLGKITAMRLRSAHDGASAGWLPGSFFNPAEAVGGAMLDLGAHAVYISAWLLGEPVAVTALLTSCTGKPLDDNAAVLVEYPGGAIAVLETSFVAGPKVRTMELSGTLSSYRTFASMDNPTIPYDVRLYSNNAPEGWVIPAHMPEELPLCIPHWVECIRTGEAPVYDMASAIVMTKVMQSAYLSAREGRRVLCSELEGANG